MTRGMGQLALVVVIVAGLTAMPVAGVRIGGPAANSAEAAGVERTATSALQACDYAELFEEAIDGVVLVAVEGGQGSGWVWQVDDGTSYVVTNQHVVGENTSAFVRFSEGETLPGEVVGTDPLADLAVVRVEDTPAYVTALPLSDREARPGEAVAALGSPFGLERTITQGIVSGTNRTLPNVRGYAIPRSIQTDAAINPGNSGGPLLACDGAVLGVNTAGGGNDIGFAISTPVVREVVPALVSGGEYDHAFLGVQAVTLDPILAAANDLDVDRGVYVLDVSEGSPASGVLQGATDEEVVDGARVPVGGDVILAVDGRTVATRDDLLGVLLTETRPGEEVELTILRDGERRTVTVALGERPETQQA